jgi:hypothetical protein
VTPPKNIEATQTICARLPGSQPTSTSAISTSRRAMPPRAISVPAKTKKITASSGKVLIAVSMRWTMVALSTPGSSSVPITDAMPTAKEIGRPSAVSRRKAAPRMARVTAHPVRSYPCVELFASGCASVALAIAVDSYDGACPYRRAGCHFAGTCASPPSSP